MAKTESTNTTLNHFSKKTVYIRIQTYIHTNKYLIEILSRNAKLKKIIVNEYLFDGKCSGWILVVNKKKTNSAKNDVSMKTRKMALNHHRLMMLHIKSQWKINVFYSIIKVNCILVKLFSLDKFDQMFSGALSSKISRDKPRYIFQYQTDNLTFVKINCKQPNNAQTQKNSFRLLNFEICFLNLSELINLIGLGDWIQKKF